MIKRKELTDPKSCINKADDDEMVFVLLGRDKSAPAAIRAWIKDRIERQLNCADDDQLTEAEECARWMESHR